MSWLSDKPKAGAFPRGLRRKKRVEHLISYLGRNARTVIANPDLDPIAEVLCRGRKVGL